ncbi:uncharacterized protein LOC110389853 isoform X2 [Numida meleagris]|uniref:uncharacterized protein LOC110389853 isoform X2 n=1 Tax=Numida meleagris TaxID=8996 RepID=UPI000B3E34FA|nr:uncharacterized protein LOC110389853 isoform X2 [Numida meleagris]
MDEDQYSYPEENIPLSLLPWFWKKKRNSVSPADKSQSKTEAWIEGVTPSSSCVPDVLVRSDPEPKPQAIIHSSAPLPGSIMNLSEEIQENLSCGIETVTTEETPEQNAEGKFWLHKLGTSINKWSQLNSLIELGENRALEKDHPNTSGVCSDLDHKVTELEEGKTNEELPYIPYKLATLYITKVVKDMQETKCKHMKIIRQLENIKKENQEQTTNTVKLYGDKMRSLKSQLEAYRELMNKNSKYWQNIAKSLRESNNQLSQEKEDLLHQMKQQTEKWEEKKEIQVPCGPLGASEEDTQVWILENLSKKISHLYTQHTLTLQEFHSIGLYVGRVSDLVNFQIKILQQKSEKAEVEKADVPILKSLAEQVANEEKSDSSVEMGPLCQAQTMLHKIQKSLQKQEREVSELLESERRYNKATNPQITVLVFLKNLAEKVHTIYCDVPEAQQYIDQLVRKNEVERADWKEAFNNAQADILSNEVFYGSEPMDGKSDRTQLSTKLFRNLGRAKSELESVETEKIVFDCIQTGEIPSWIKRDCLYVALTDHKDACSEETSHHLEEIMQKFEMEMKQDMGRHRGLQFFKTGSMHSALGRNHSSVDSLWIPHCSSLQGKLCQCGLFTTDCSS